MTDGGLNETQERDGWVRRVERSAAVPILIVVIPFVVAAIRLASRRWVPVLDMAMTDLRVRDVGTANSPLIGLPGRIGNFPDQGSHPGPLSFYLLAPMYRLFGSTGGALLVSTCVLAAGCGAATVAMARQACGATAAWVAALVVGVTIVCLGIPVVTQPWNPFLPLMFWMVALVGSWAVLAGRHRLLLVVVGAASVCAQTHISYAVQAAGVFGLALAAVAVGAWRGTGGQRRDHIASMVLSLGLGVVLWLPVIIDQLTRARGNLGYIREDFASKPVHTIGLRSAATLIARHLDLPGALLSKGHSDVALGPDQLAGSAWIGLAFVLLGILGAVVAVRSRNRPLIALDVVVAAAGVLAWLSASRIYGTVWFYLTMWAYVLAPLLALSIAWSGWLLLGPKVSDPGWRRRARSGVVVLAVAVASMLSVQSSRVVPPDDQLSRPLRTVMGPTARALDQGAGAATGRSGHYVVRWDDALYFGSQGYGLLDELERRGFDVGAPRLWRVPVTRHRVREASDADAIVQLATGSYIDVWRGRSFAREVAYADSRTAVEVAKFARLRRQLIHGLRGADLDDLADLVDRNLFALVSDPRSPPFAQDLAGQMLEIGAPIAVFIVPTST